jgi:hypothetical protein
VNRELAAERGLHGRVADAFVEAKVLEAALTAVGAGQSIGDPWVGASPKGESTADEVTWLREVAGQFSPPKSVWHDGAVIRSEAGKVV